MISTRLLVDGGETTLYDYTIPYITITTTSPTNAAVVVGTPPTSPASYKAEYSTSSTFATIAGTVNTANGIFSLTTLTAGQLYYIRARAYSGASATGVYGPYIVQEFTMPVLSNVGSIGTTPGSSTTPVNFDATATSAALRKLTSGQTLTDAEKILLGMLPSTPTGASSPSQNGVNPTPGATSGVGTSVAINGKLEVQKSLFTVSSSNTQNTASVAEKDMIISTSSNYYTFGTTLFFSSNVADTKSCGGIGFFTSNGGSSGYFIELQTTSNLANKDEKEVRVYKVVNNQKIRVPDTQSGRAKSFNGLYGGQSYKVDVKVEVQATKVIINVYVNNLIITATDSNQINTTDPAKMILPKTSKMVMYSLVNKSNFDYIYAIPVTEPEYKSAKLINVYNGQFSSTSLKFLYGQKVIDNFNKTTVTDGKLEEFGTIARELRKVDIKYNSRPAFPMYPSVGVNSFISIIGSKLGSFGAEVYLLNNSGTYVPLDDSGSSSFSIIGNYISESGQYDYTDTLSNEYDNPEPATFDSIWIQSEPDAKSMSDWIKKQWSKQQIVLEMQVFGNPLISVGDVIVVKYPSNDLDGTQKFIVTNVSNSYKEGLETSITCRSIYS
jgi:hypothetical protein